MRSFAILGILLFSLQVFSAETYSCIQHFNGRTREVARLTVDSRDPESMSQIFYNGTLMVLNHDGSTTTYKSKKVATRADYETPLQALECMILKTPTASGDVFFTAFTKDGTFYESVLTADAHVTFGHLSPDCL